MEAMLNYAFTAANEVAKDLNPRKDTFTNCSEVLKKYSRNIKDMKTTSFSRRTMMRFIILMPNIYLKILPLLLKLGIVKKGYV